jgi:peroxiredoxin Q/BCP
MLGIVTALHLAPVSRCQPAGPTSLEPGDKAPDFRLQGSDGKEYTLKQFQGQSAVALVWFLRAGSGGSKTQLSVIQEKLDQISRHNVQVLGITTSTLAECRAFATELELTFPLLSDPDRTVATAYGALRNGTGPTCERWVFLIDDTGVIGNIEKGEAVADKANLLLRALGDRTTTAQATAPPALAAPKVITVGPVTYTISAPTVAPANPAVTSNLVTVGPDRYTVYSYDDHASASYVVVVPEGLKTVRGLLVNGCYSGGDSRWDWPTCEYYRQFMHLHGFALVATTATTRSPGSAPRADATPQARHRAIFQGFEDSMRVIATASQHPELANAPYVGVGFSAGGGFAFNLMVFAPEKTIAAASYSAPYMFKRRLTPPPTEALLHVPSICITGEQEGFNAPLPPDVDPATGPGRIDEVFVPYRPQGAEYAWMERQGIGHTYDENRQDALGMPLLDAAVRARYPQDGDVTQGPIKLIDLDPATGWIADNATWKSGLTTIIPATEFQGDLGHSSWLQNEDLAFIYRAYSTYDKPLTITSPGNCWPTMPALDPGASVPITVDASRFPNWQTMAFYDGARKLGTVTAEPAQFTATSLTPGYHVFSVLATDDRGTLRTADPKMVVVRRSPAER